MSIPGFVDSPMLRSLALVAPDLVVLFSALLLMVFEFLMPRQRERLPALGIAGLVPALWLSIDQLSGPHGDAFAGALAIDRWTVMFRILGYAGGLFTLLLSFSPGAVGGLVPRDRARSDRGLITVLVLLACAGFSVMAASRDMLVTVIGLEILSLALYPMMTLAGTRESHEAAAKYFLMGAAASAVMLFGLSFQMGATGSVRYSAVEIKDPTLRFAFVLFVTGLLFKAAAVPFHSWMPDVYEATPAPLGIFMASAVKAAAFAALGRIIVETLPTPGAIVRVMLAITALTLLMGNGGALFQKSLTRLLGYSSVAHTGFLLMGLTATAQASLNPNSPFPLQGCGAVLFYLIGYIPSVIAAYAVVAVVERDAEADPYLAGARGLDRLHGLYARHPVLAVAAAVVFASMAGLPPTIGFWGKFEILRASYGAGHLGLVAVALFCTLLGAYYYLGVIRAIFTPAAGSTAALSAPRMASLCGALLASLFIIAFGILPDAMIRLAIQSASAIAR